MSENITVFVCAYGISQYYKRDWRVLNQVQGYHLNVYKKIFSLKIYSFYQLIAHYFAKKVKSLRQWILERTFTPVVLRNA